MSLLLPLQNINCYTLLHATAFFFFVGLSFLLFAPGARANLDGRLRPPGHPASRDRVHCSAITGSGPEASRTGGVVRSCRDGDGLAVRGAWILARRLWVTYVCLQVRVAVVLPANNGFRLFIF